MPLGALFDKSMGELPVEVSRAQWFFANNWPLRVWLSAFSLVVPLGALRTINVSAALAAGWRLWLGLLGLSLLFAAIGLLIGAVFAGVLGPLYRLRTRLNGGPFAAGDIVVVLGGKYRGRRGRVYSPWQGETVRVELGEQEKAGFRDVFGQHQLLKL